MRWLLLILIGALVGADVHAELFVQDKSVSPDGKIVFAINYPPTQTHPNGYTQGCFLHAKSRKLIGQYFFLPGSYADTDHPGTYGFDNYHVLDYLWSDDSRYVAVTLNGRRWNRVYVFRRQGAAFQMLETPDLYPQIDCRMKGALVRSPNTETRALSWTEHHHLIMSVSQGAKLTQSGDDHKDWRQFSVEATVAFAPDGKAMVKSTKLGVEDFL